MMFISDHPINKIFKYLSQKEILSCRYTKIFYSAFKRYVSGKLEEHAKSGHNFASLCERGVSDFHCGIYETCVEGHYEIIKFMMDKKGNRLASAPLLACKGGNIKIVSLLMEMEGMKGACEGGHMNLIHLMMERGAGELDRRLYIACKESNKELALFFIESGA